MQQGRGCPSPRNHPALRRILGEEMPHLFPLPRLLPVSGVGGWGEVLKEEKAAEAEDETGTVTRTGASSKSTTNFAAGRKRSRFETWEEQDEDNGSDDGYHARTGELEASSNSTCATLPASNLTSTTYTF